jgi:hypothetical protein
MFSAKNTDTPNPFRPALQYLLNVGKSTSPSKVKKHRRSTSSGSLDLEGDSPNSRMSYNPKSSTEFRNSPIPLISISRSPSPYARRHSNSNAGSETSEDEWGDTYNSSLSQPFLGYDGYKPSGVRGFLRQGGFGQWLFTTNIGWAFYIAVLVFWLGGCQIGLTIMNRIILWSGYLKENHTSHTKLMKLIAGVYKFPYPLTTTLIEMCLTHCWIILSAYITRWVSPWLIDAGLSGMIAPSRPLQSTTSPPGFRGQPKKGVAGAISQWLSVRSGGIAGGGLFEFDWPVVKQCLPLAIIFVLKLVLSNISFGYAQIEIYSLARIGIVPISLILTAFLSQQQHSVAILSSTLTATLTLLVATIRSNVRVTWEPIVAGVFSSFFVALYPVQIQRTYKSLLASLVPQGDILTTIMPPNATSHLPPDASGSPAEARAYWRVIHYTSLLSIMIFLPLPFIFGEITNISRNCYFLDVFFHWLMVFCGGLGSWAVFWSTIALTRATSPLTTAFLFVPRAAFLLPIMWGFKMPSFAWIGMGMCWASCAWYVRARRKEGKFRGLR